MTLYTTAVDYHDPQQADELVALLDHYACDPMGGGEPLPESVRRQLPTALAQRPQALSLLCYEGGRAIGLLNAFEGFSTFQCRPLLNIHDVIVHREKRGCGVAQQLLQAVEQVARTRGCCKLTLEVLSENTVAQRAYQRFGFSAYELDPEMGSARFWQKNL